MPDSAAERRFPARVRGGNGVTITWNGNVPTFSANLDTLTVTPAGAAAPVNLRDTLAMLIANAKAQQYVSVIDDGFFDQPVTGNKIITDDGWF